MSFVVSTRGATHLGRNRNLQFRTNHYHPERVSDPMCGALLNGLQAKGYTANAYEGRTLVLLRTLRADDSA